MELKKNLESLHAAITSAIKNKIDLTKKLDPEKALYNYEEKQKVYYLNNFLTKLKAAKSSALQLPGKGNEPYVSQILELIPELDEKDLTKLEKTVRKLLELSRFIVFPKLEQDKIFSFPRNVPDAILSDIKADISELNRCFASECYRSSIILCGRLLETALHRKYYELTKNDLLEKSPGIGLGNIIAKLKESNLGLDPAITNQIHLINQVRIFSVHKKKEAFYPSRQQTEATILYTLDILEKLFL